MENKKIAMYAGSFDPFTNGHLSILEEASLLFDEVIVCIAYNPNKKRKTHEVDMCAAIEKTIALSNIKNVKVIVYEGLVADACKLHNATYLVRGLRNTSDYMYEENIAKINFEINPELKTIYFRAKNEVISSSMVRELQKYEKDISQYVPEAVLEII